MPRTPVIEFPVFEEICRYSSVYASFKIPREKWVECMGYLFAKIPEPEDTEYVITEAVGMTAGSEMRVEMNPEDLAKIEKMQSERPGMFLGGWWHTHPGLSLFFSETDIQNQSFYQQHNEDGLGIVFDLETIGTLNFDADGNRIPSFIGFKIFRNDPKRKEGFAEVGYRLRGFSEEGLRKAFDYIGGIPDWMVHNIAVCYGLKEGKLYGVPDLHEAESEPNESRGYARETLAKVSGVRKDFLSASENLYIAALCFAEAGKLDRAVDDLFAAAEAGLKARATYMVYGAMEKVLSLLEGSESEDADYYRGRAYYFMGLARWSDKNPSLTAHMMSNALKYYDPEEDAEEAYAAAEFMGSAYEAMGYKRGAVAAYRRCLFYAVKAREALIDEEGDSDEISRWKNNIKKMEEKIAGLEGELKSGSLKKIA